MKQDITKYFFEIYLKMTIIDYQIIAAVNYKTIILSPLKEEHFTEVSTERCSSKFCLGAIIKIILKCL